jgi:platelet-activating factor acetylhydrolase IB subunit beta/gamma
MPRPAAALDYAYATPEPQKTGWPLSAEEEAYVLKPEYERRPGAEITQHKPELWPVVPSAGFWGGRSWLDTHAKLVQVAEASKGPIDILLVGDSITMQWGAAWQKHFGKYKTVNIGIGGDKTQNVLWRLDHGGVDGLEPKLVVLLIGNNNMFFTPETGIEPAARGIKVCADNLREKFPAAELVVVKVFPAHAPGNPFYEDIKKVNAALDGVGLDADPKIHVLDIWPEMVEADGTLKKGLFTSDNIHLTQEGGYDLYARRLAPLVEKLLGGEKAPAADQPAAPPANKAAAAALPAYRYAYTPYNDGLMDPQRTGWPLSAAEREYVLKPEYTRKPGHEANQHLPHFWPIVPTAGSWGSAAGDTRWLDHHAALVEAVRTAPQPIDVLLVGDSLTQHWGGGALESQPFRPAWKRRFGHLATVNIGIGGDRTEGVLWRLDHGAIDAANPRVVVLLIGVNNAPLVAANGVPAAAVAEGIALCARGIRRHAPSAEVVVVKPLPAFAQGSPVHDAVRQIGAAVDAVRIDDEPRVHVVDLAGSFTTTSGDLVAEAYDSHGLHLTEAGYELLAAGLEPHLTRLLSP